MHFSPERRRRAAAAGGLALAVALSVTTLQGSASASTPPSPAGLLPATTEKAATAATLTLITGDTVAVTTQTDGKQAVDVVAEAGTSKVFQVATGQDGDLYVYPEDALTAVAAGTVDRELFNVTRTIEDGHGDAKSDGVPAIIDFQGTQTAAALKQKSEDLPGSESERVMPRLGLAAVEVDKDRASGFWRAVRPTAATTKSGRTTAMPGSAGVAKVWYDGKAQVTLDQSVPQIGAPQAWAAGVRRHRREGRGAGHRRRPEPRRHRL